MAFKKILVVDDEENIIHMIKRAVEAATGYEVIEANSGREALSLAAKEKPDMVILDVVMPGMDGGEVAEKMKLDKNLKDIPIVFLTAIVKKEETKKHEGIIGGRTFLSKPIQLQDLLKCIEEKIGSAEKNISLD